jgi:hypothetical protein
MPLYLDEIWLKWSSAEQATQALKQFRSMGSGQFPYPEGVALAAGPWFSNEEAKIILVLDIADHTKTFGAFGLALVHGLIKRRRLTPIVAWNELEAVVEKL